MKTSTDRPRKKRAARGPASPNHDEREPDRILEVSGLELFVRERGSGHPLLLINGLGGNLEMWAPVEASLGKTSRLIMFDGPGMGRSQTSLVPMTIASLARIARSVIDRLGHERVDVLGYSLGGVIAQQLARDAPERIRRLALVSTACGWGSVPAGLPALTAVATPWRYYSGWLYRQYGRVLGELDAAGFDAEAQAARLRFPPSPLGYAYQVCAGACWSSLPWLHSVEVPTIVVSGAADRLVPRANSMQLAGLLPNSRLHLISGEGHLLLLGRSTSHALLADFFGGATIGDSRAWATGQDVGHEEMRDAMRAATGGQPVKAFSDAYRWLLDARGRLRAE